MMTRNDLATSILRAAKEFVEAYLAERPYDLADLAASEGTTACRLGFLNDFLAAIQGGGDSYVVAVGLDELRRCAVFLAPRSRPFAGRPFPHGLDLLKHSGPCGIEADADPGQPRADYPGLPETAPFDALGRHPSKKRVARAKAVALTRHPFAARVYVVHASFGGDDGEGPINVIDDVIETRALAASSVDLPDGLHLVVETGDTVYVGRKTDWTAMFPSS